MPFSTLNNFPILGVCVRCSGRGAFNAFKHVEGGRCFGCNGQGVKVYGSEKFAWELADRADRIDIIAQGLAMLEKCLSDESLRGNINARWTAYSFVSSVALKAREAGDEDVWRRAHKALEARVQASAPPPPPAPAPEQDDRHTDEGDREAEEAEWERNLEAASRAYFDDRAA